MERPWLTRGPLRRQTAADVLDEIQRRERAGLALNSGANRGDWLYAAAVRHFGSWRAALEAAGFAYEGVKLTAASAEDVLHGICELAAAGAPLYAYADRRLANGAKRHFGSWRAAVQAAGCALPVQQKWTADAVLARIRGDLQSGRSLCATDVLARDENLYGAARRRFGSWAEALRVADPTIPPPRRGRPRRAPAPSDGAATP